MASFRVDNHINCGVENSGSLTVNGQGLDNNLLEGYPIETFLASCIKAPTEFYIRSISDCLVKIMLAKGAQQQLDTMCCKGKYLGHKWQYSPLQIFSRY